MNNNSISRKPIFCKFPRFSPFFVGFFRALKKVGQFRKMTFRMRQLYFIRYQKPLVSRANI